MIEVFVPDLMVISHLLLVRNVLNVVMKAELQADNFNDVV